MAVQGSRTRRTVPVSKLLLEEPKGPCVPLIRSKANGTACEARCEGKTYKIQQSSVLSQVKSFLPQLAQANTHLDHITAATSDNEDERNRLNIEYISDEEEEHVEMNFAVVPLAFCTTSDDEQVTDSSEDEGITELRTQPRSSTSRTLNRLDNLPIKKIQELPIANT